MLFKRKNPRPLLRRIRNFIWPDMGLRRFVVYVKQRVIRLGDTPRNVALGLAFGVATSFNPFVGTHILQACVLAFLFRANYAAAALGTVIGNPLTFPFMWGGAAFAGTFFVQDSFWAWVIGAYLVGAVMVPVCYFIFLPLVKGARLVRQALIARVKKKRDDEL